MRPTRCLLLVPAAATCFRAFGLHQRHPVFHLHQLHLHSFNKTLRLARTIMRRKRTIRSLVVYLKPRLAPTSPKASLTSTAPIKCIPYRNRFLLHLLYGLRVSMTEMKSIRISTANSWRQITISLRSRGVCSNNLLTLPTPPLTLLRSNFKE